MNRHSIFHISVGTTQSALRRRASFAEEGERGNDVDVGHLAVLTDARRPHVGLDFDFGLKCTGFEIGGLDVEFSFLYFPP
jgi:hypothetical protein